VRLEDFYDVPEPEIVLLGGPRNGERMRIPGGLAVLLPQVVLRDPPPEPEVQRPVTARELLMRPATVPVTVYRFTGSILDDGTRVYRAWTS
jgi:hypothetical protein